MSTITLSLPADTETKLRRQADSAGLSFETYIGQHLGKLAEPDVAEAPRAKSFEQIAEPFRRGFEESGMTDEEFLELAQEAVREVRAERRLRNPS